LAVCESNRVSGEISGVFAGSDFRKDVVTETDALSRVWQWHPDLAAWLPPFPPTQTPGLTLTCTIVARETDPSAMLEEQSEQFIAFSSHLLSVFFILIVFFNFFLMLLVGVCALKLRAKSIGWVIASLVSVAMMTKISYYIAWQLMMPKTIYLWSIGLIPALGFLLGVLGLKAKWDRSMRAVTALPGSPRPIATLALAASKALKNGNAACNAQSLIASRTPV